MPKKIIEEEPEPDYEPPADYSEPDEPEQPEEEKAEPIKISKKTGKPVRQLSEKQLLNLQKAREKALEKKKEITQSKDYQNRAEVLRKIKEEKEQRLEVSKQKYEEEKQEYEEVIVKKPKEKKVKKKIIKYVEASSSSESEEEEIIVKKKKKKPPTAPEPSMSEQVTKQKLKSKLEEEQSASLAKLMMPSYF